eukprot:scaffold4903_cov142-Skeletonema_menzelii.AAC.7
MSGQEGGTSLLRLLTLAVNPCALILANTLRLAQDLSAPVRASPLFVFGGGGGLGLGLGVITAVVIEDEVELSLLRLLTLAVNPCALILVITLSLALDLSAPVRASPLFVFGGGGGLGLGLGVITAVVIEDEVELSLLRLLITLAVNPCALVSLDTIFFLFDIFTIIVGGGGRVGVFVSGQEGGTERGATWSPSSSLPPGEPTVDMSDRPPPPWLPRLVDDTQHRRANYTTAATMVASRGRGTMA